MYQTICFTNAKTILPKKLLSYAIHGSLAYVVLAFIYSMYSSQMIHRRVKDTAFEVALLCVSFSLTNILLASVDNTDKVSALTIIAGTVAGLQLLSCTRSPKQYPYLICGQSDTH